VALARVGLSLFVLASGFRAISDDDYSRVVIAARFAQHPSPDPSGTSWLPLPFWLYGVPMALFGDSLTTARVVAVLLGAGSAVLVWVAARQLGLSDRAALGGALFAVVLRYGSWLSAATVPEAPTAALILVGVVCLVNPSPKARAWAGVALGAACFCRYEAWAPALFFGVLTGVDAVRTRQRALWLGVAFSMLPIGLWLLHGVVRHGDALFFVARVNAYRTALGQTHAGWLTALWQTPWSLVRFEPEVCALTLATLVLIGWRREWPFGPGAWRPVAALATLVGFLVAASATGGSATHHPERSLLPVFWFLPLVLAGLFAQLLRKPLRLWQFAALLAPTLLASRLLRPWEVHDTFVDRGEEERIGSVLRRLDAHKVALDTDDFGFFAVQAALGCDKSFALSDHDPRKAEAPRASTSPALAQQLQESNARWLVTTRERAALAKPLGAVRLSTPRLTLIQLEPASLAALGAQSR
jgi:Dolichyl-phosphate-mannose-protein mannosyltransferase